jgi:hypothetical protein
MMGLWCVTGSSDVLKLRTRGQHAHGGCALAGVHARVGSMATADPAGDSRRPGSTGSAHTSSLAYHTTEGMLSRVGHALCIGLWLQDGHERWQIAAAAVNVNGKSESSA